MVLLTAAMLTSLTACGGGEDEENMIVGDDWRTWGWSYIPMNLMRGADYIEGCLVVDSEKALLAYDQASYAVFAQIDFERTLTEEEVAFAAKASYDPDYNNDGYTDLCILPSSEESWFYIYTGIGEDGLENYELLVEDLTGSEPEEEASSVDFSAAVGYWETEEDCEVCSITIDEEGGYECYSSADELLSFGQLEDLPVDNFEGVLYNLTAEEGGSFGSIFLSDAGIIYLNSEDGPEFIKKEAE